MLDDGICATIAELARRERVSRSYVSRVLRLTLLAPDVVEAILDGRQPEGMRLEDLLAGFRWNGRDKSAHLAAGEINGVSRTRNWPGPPPVLPVCQARDHPGLCVRHLTYSVFRYSMTAVRSASVKPSPKR